MHILSCVSRINYKILSLHNRAFHQKNVFLKVDRITKETYSLIHPIHCDAVSARCSFVLSLLPLLHTVFELFDDRTFVFNNCNWQVRYNKKE